MHDERKMKFNSNFNFGVENEIVWCLRMRLFDVWDWMDNVDNLPCWNTNLKNWNI